MTEPRTPVFTATRIAELIAVAPDQVLAPTPEQQRVIEHPIGGSALVIAGAGSGKTETIANRVVWLLANGFVEPSEVLGLTFTRKAAGELGERIGRRLHAFASALDERESRGMLSDAERGAAARFRDHIDGGLNVPSASTYDSFAAHIVQEFGAFAGIDPDLRLIDAATAWRIARSVLLRSRDPELSTSEESLATLIDHTLSLDHASADHQAGLHAIEQVLEEFGRIGELPYDAKSAARVAPPRLRAPVRDVIADTQVTRLGVRLASEFAEEKRRLGVVEFSDQLRNALRTVEGTAAATAALRRRYRVVLLDEVQDTSVSQTRLLSRVFAGCSVMAVGDPHQSIYGWRGASAQGLQRFHDEFAGRGDARDTRATLTLSTSWRNPKSVLRAANTLSQPLQDGAAMTVPPLRPAEHATDGLIEWVYPETVFEERNLLAAWMREARDDFQARHGRPATAAVLLRARKDMPRIADALRAVGVQCRIVGVGGLLTTPEVTDVVSVLQCLWHADASNALIRVLAGPRFRIGVSDLAALRDTARWFEGRDASHLRLSAADALPDAQLRHPDRAFTLLDALDEIAGMRSLEHRALAGISEIGRARLKEAGIMLRHLRSLTGDGILTLIRAVEQALRLDIELDAVQRGDEHTEHLGSTSRVNLDLFTDQVQQFLHTDEEGTLASVLAWLERAARDDQVSEHVPPPEPGTVQLITMHGAKGLEWDLVAVPRMVRGGFPGTPREGVGWLRKGQLPDELRGDATARPVLQWRLATTQKEFVDDLETYKSELKERFFEEERRLAYVALTRSASRLFLSGSFWGGQKTSRPPSEFLCELEDAGVIAGLPVASSHETDPHAEAAETVFWPFDPLGARSEAVHRAAESVRAVLASGAAQQIDPVVRLLIAEQQMNAAPQGDVDLERINASSFHEFVTDPARARRHLVRPIPQRPYRRTHLGNQFHEWVERRTTTPLGTALTLWGGEFDVDEGGFWEFDLSADGSELDDLPAAHAANGVKAANGVNAAQSALLEADQLSHLIAHFERSRWGDRQPIATELQITLPFAGRRLVCKLDAVFQIGEGDQERFEVVDWKTGRPPRSETEREARFFQLDLYRHAYAQWANVAPERIDVSLFYVADEVELRSDRPRSLDELERIWLRALGREGE